MEGTEKENMKKIVILAGALFIAAVAVPQAQATLIMSNTVVLGDVSSTPTPTPEDLTVSYQVNLTGGIYTYSYVINNPTGDITLSGANAGKSEIVEQFDLNVNISDPNQYIAGSQAGEIAVDMIANASGLTWENLNLSPGASSPTLSFESYEPPTLGAANANDDSPPSPWSSLSANGQLVAVPGAVTIPDGGMTVALLGGALIGLRAIRRTFRN